jgi:hypothetical protein
MSRLTVGSIEGLTENSNVISVPTGHTLNAVDGLQIGGTAVGEWTAYTPTTYSLTIGNGTLTGRYTRINNLVFFNVSFVLGSTSAVTSNVAFGLPVTRVLTGVSGANGYYQDSGTSYEIPAVCGMGTTTVNLRVMTANSTYVTTQLISATVPFTWATNDTMALAGFYEAA